MTTTTEKTVANVQMNSSNGVKGIHDINLPETFVGFYQIDSNGQQINFIPANLPKDFDSLSVRVQVGTICDSLFKLQQEARLFNAKVFDGTLPVFIHFHVNDSDKEDGTLHFDSANRREFRLKFKLNKLARTQKEFAKRLFYLVSTFQYGQRKIDVAELCGELELRSLQEREYLLAFQSFASSDKEFTEAMEARKELTKGALDKEERKAIMGKPEFQEATRKVSKIRQKLMLQFQQQRSLPESKISLD